MARVIFQCSGSEANDTAIKLAWYYWHAKGEPQRSKIIARQMAYHGNTCAAVSLSGKPDMHAGFGLPFANFKHTEFPHYYRRHEAGESEEQFSARMAEALEQLIQDEGPDTIAAFFAEPVMGAGGAIMPPKGYFEKVQAVLRKYDILFVADEVICGFARTGEMWGSQTYGIRPDMITSAKALSAAMQPISAVLINRARARGDAGPVRHATAISPTATPTPAIPSPRPWRSRCRRSTPRWTSSPAPSGSGPCCSRRSASSETHPPRRRRARHRPDPRHGADAGRQGAHSLRVRARRRRPRRRRRAAPRPDRARGRRPAGVRPAADHRGAARSRTIAERLGRALDDVANDLQREGALA